MMVKDCMQSDVVYVSVPGVREDVLQLMAEKQINGLPVVKKGTKTLVGIVTRTDLLRKADENQLALLMKRDPVTVSPSTNVVKAASIMLENKYRRLPVVSKGELVGVVSVPDIISATLEENKKYEKESIADYTVREVVSVWDQTPLPLSYMMMEMAGRTSLVVVNASGGVAGLITVSDFIRLSEVTTEDNVSATYGGEESSVGWDWTSKDFLVVTKRLLKLPNVPVGQIMTQNMISVSEVTTVAECVRTLRKNEIDQAPVLSASGNLIGMIEDRDLLSLAIKALEE
ncbi:MAG: CBS domain-containing protein [Candidatus Thorarchaeota archaeon]